MWVSLTESLVNQELYCTVNNIIKHNKCVNDSQLTFESNSNRSTQTTYDAIGADGTLNGKIAHIIRVYW